MPSMCAGQQMHLARGQDSLICLSFLQVVPTSSNRGPLHFMLYSTPRQ